MNKKFQKAIALGIVFSMIIVNISFAEEKNTIKKNLADTGEVLPCL